VAKRLVVREHYLGTMPGGTRLAFGVFAERRLLGVLTLGVGPSNVHRLVDDAEPDDCLTLTRLWLNDLLPANSESKVIGVTLRALKRQTSVKFVVAYADPAAGHVGTIYQATNWLYTGTSQATALLDLGDGVLQHSPQLGARIRYPQPRSLCRARGGDAGGPAVSEASLHLLSRSNLATATSSPGAALSQEGEAR